jgi:hypothetical protein
MKHVLMKHYDHYAILNDDADFSVGRVYPLDGGRGFRVTADLAPDDCDDDTVAIVRSLGDAVQTLAAYYKRNPPRWERESATRYTEWTQFALLAVEQDQRGYWLPLRDSYPMLRNGKPATFATREEAQRVAGAHLLDHYPNSKTVDDGLTWVRDPEIDWRSCPHRVEARARFERIDLAA